MDSLDVLERIFPQHAAHGGSGYGTQYLAVEHQITIGGLPIGECLSTMMAVIRSQQQTIDSLQHHVTNQSTDHLQRLDRLERYVTLLTRDVKLDQRPLPAYGQAPMPTIADAINTVEYRLTQVENKRRQQLLRTVFEIANRGKLRSSWEQWALVARAKGMMRDLSVGQNKRIRQRYLQKWIRFLAFSKANAVSKRKVRALSYLSSKGIVQRYYDKWRRFIVVSRDDKIRQRMEAQLKVEGMASISHRALARRYLAKWSHFLTECHSMKYRLKQVVLLETSKARALCLRYVMKWFAHHRLMHQLRRKMVIVDQRSAKVFRGLATRYLDKWKRFSHRRIARRHVRSVIPRMHHLQLVALARRYFAKFELFSKIMAERREKEAMQLAIQQLARRCDALGAQLDLGLQTLSHTNGVLSKVLEHVSFNSSWEKKSSASASPARANPVGTAAAANPVAAHQTSWEGALESSPWGGAAGGGMTADELLLQLRSRLQKINQPS